MIGSLLDKLAGRLDQRFLANVSFPSFAFLMAVGSLTATHLGWKRLFDWWDKLSSTEAAWLIAGTVTTWLLVSALVVAWTRDLVRLYEGYWGSGPLSGTLARYCIGGQERRLKKLTNLDSNEAYEERYYTFPAPGVPLLPTRLGNVLRAAESYSGDSERYGMDGVFFWPRLYSILPDALRSGLGEARSDLDRMVLVSGLAVVVALTATAYGTLGSLPAAFWVPSAVGAALVARLAYSGAVRAAMVFGDLVRASFDLHRRTLLRTMGLVLPRTLSAERTLWASVQKQLYRRATDDGVDLVFAPSDKD